MPSPSHEGILLIFPLKAVQSKLHLKLILVYGGWWWSRFYFFFFLVNDCLAVPTPFVKKEFPFSIELIGAFLDNMTV